MSSRDLTLAVWAALALWLVVLVFVSHLRSHLVPSPRTAVSAVVFNPLGRLLVVLGWMWLGWHFFAR